MSWPGLCILQWCRSMLHPRRLNHRDTKQVRATHCKVTIDQDVGLRRSIQINSSHGRFLSSVRFFPMFATFLYKSLTMGAFSSYDL